MLSIFKFLPISSFVTFIRKILYLLNSSIAAFQSELNSNSSLCFSCWMHSPLHDYLVRYILAPLQEKISFFEIARKEYIFWPILKIRSGVSNLESLFFSLWIEIFGMASVSLFVFFVLSHLVLLHSAEKEEGKRENTYCLPSQCGKLGNISFPFTKIPLLFQSCVLMHVECDEPHPMIHLPLGDPGSERRYEVINISHTNTTHDTTHPCQGPLAWNTWKPINART